MYHIVVGDVSGEAKVESTLVKLQTVESDLLRAPELETPSPYDGHWQPNFWPLP
jgi:hypothetical protein